MTDAVDELLGRIDLEDVRRRLDAALRTVRRLRPEGRVFLASGARTFVGEELLAGLSDDERAALLEEAGCEEIGERVLPGWRWELSCSNPGSMVSGEWGFRSFDLGSRGYFVEDPDHDFLAEAPYRLLGAWEPADSKTAYEAAWVEVYVREWCHIGLPPASGMVEYGTPHLILRASQRIVASDRSAQESESFDHLVTWLAEETTRSREEIEALLGATRWSSDVRPLRSPVANARHVPLDPSVWAITPCRPKPVRAEDLLPLIDDATIDFRKVYGMFGQINIDVVDVTPEELTVSVWTRKPIDPRRLARNVRGNFLRCRVEAGTYLVDCVPCEWFRCLIVNPDDRGQVRREFRLRYRSLAQRAGLLSGDVVPVDTGLRPLPMSLRLRLAWQRLLEASRSGGPSR